MEKTQPKEKELYYSTVLECFAGLDSINVRLSDTLITSNDIKSRLLDPKQFNLKPLNAAEASVNDGKEPEPITLIEMLNSIIRTQNTLISMIDENLYYVNHTIGEYNK